MIIPNNFNEWLRDTGACFIDAKNFIDHANTRESAPPEYYMVNSVLGWRGKHTESLKTMGVSFKNMPWK